MHAQDSSLSGWTILLDDHAATERFARILADELRAGDLVTLSGGLGAGKTTLARALIRLLADDPGLEVPSPTFTLMQTYEGPGGRDRARGFLSPRRRAGAGRARLGRRHRERHHAGGMAGAGRRCAEIRAPACRTRIRSRGPPAGDGSPASAAPAPSRRACGGCGLSRGLSRTSGWAGRHARAHAERRVGDPLLRAAGEAATARRRC